MICASKATGTYAQYDIYLKQFSTFCLANGIRPRDPDIHDIINFLQTLIDRGLAYSTVNMARSALSYYFHYFKGVEVAKLPIVCALLDAHARNKPPVPKYLVTWDVNIMLAKFRAMEGNTSLDLKTPSFKVVMLLSITTAARGQAIHDFYLLHAAWEKDKVTFMLSKPMKHFVKGAPLETIVLYKFEQD